MIDFLPRLNAILNFFSALCLTAGFFFIRRKNVRWHRACMVTAVTLSALFLVSYVTFHLKRGNIRYTGQVRTLYFTILISHMILAATVVPLVIRTLYLAIKMRFIEHQRLARWTLPIWFYVSVTGVIIYAMVY